MWDDYIRMIGEDWRRIQAQGAAPIAYGVDGVLMMRMGHHAMYACDWKRHQLQSPC